VEADLQEVIRELAGWDGALSPDSPNAAVFEITIQRAIRLMLDAHLGDFGVRLQGKGVASTIWSNHTWEWFIRLLDTPGSPWFDLGQGEQRDDVLKSALRQAVDMLRQEQGKNNKAVAWGDLHRLTFHHVLGAQKPLDAAFSLGSYPIGGDGNTVWSSFTPYYTTETGTIVGPAFRFIADLGDLNNCWGVLAPGQSGHPASPHYRDGIRPWLDGSYHPMLFQRDAIEKNLSHQLDLQPTPG
jgi:penicillin amidase